MAQRVENILRQFEGLQPQVQRAREAEVQTGFDRILRQPSPARAPQPPGPNPPQTQGGRPGQDLVVDLRSRRETTPGAATPPTIQEARLIVQALGIRNESLRRITEIEFNPDRVAQVLGQAAQIISPERSDAVVAQLQEIRESLNQPEPGPSPVGRQVREVIRESAEFGGPRREAVPVAERNPVVHEPVARRLGISTLEKQTAPEPEAPVRPEPRADDRAQPAAEDLTAGRQPPESPERSAALEEDRRESVRTEPPEPDNRRVIPPSRSPTQDAAQQPILSSSLHQIVSGFGDRRPGPSAAAR